MTSRVLGVVPLLSLRVLPSTLFRLSSLAIVLGVGAGCELVVPSKDDLSGGVANDGGPDAGADATGTDAGDAGDPGDAGRGGPLQQASAQGSATRSLVATLASPPAAGSLLVVVAASTNATPGSVAGGGIPWVEYSTSATHIALAVWVAVSPGGISVPVTLTFPAAPQPAQLNAVVQVTEWSGLAPIAGKTYNDPAHTTLNGGTGGPIATGSLSVKNATGLVFAAAAAHNDSVTIGAPSNGFIALDDVVTGDLRLLTAYQASPPARTYSTSWTADTTQSWDAHIESFLK